MDILKKAQEDGAKIYLKTAGVNIISGARDLKVFTGEIDEDEKILAIVTGKLVQVSNDRSRGMGFFGATTRATGTDTKGVMVITNQKAVFADKRLFGKQMTVIDGMDINSITMSGGIMSSRVEIMTHGTKYDVTDLKKDAASEAVKALKTLKKLTKGSAGGNTTIHQAASGMEEIKKAKELFDAGIISEEEFNNVKKKHLG